MSPEMTDAMVQLVDVIVKEHGKLIEPNQWYNFKFSFKPDPMTFYKIQLEPQLSALFAGDLQQATRFFKKGPD
jgi:hypothetical protein